MNLKWSGRWDLVQYWPARSHDSSKCRDAVSPLGWLVLLTKYPEGFQIGGLGAADPEGQAAYPMRGARDGEFNGFISLSMSLEAVEGDRHYYDSV